MSDTFNISLAATNKVTPPLADPTGLWPNDNYKIEYSVSTVHTETAAVDITFPLLDVPPNMTNPVITQFVYSQKGTPDGPWTQAPVSDPNDPPDPAVPFSVNSSSSSSSCPSSPFTVHDYHNSLNDYKFLLFIDYTSGNTTKTFIVDPEIHNREN
jgi:hypothetical protein